MILKISPFYSVFIGLGCILFTGCSDGKPQRIPVQGKVIFEKMDTPQTGTVYFAPISSDTPGLKRPAHALFDQSGTFSVTSFGKDSHDGLLPGKYKVYVEAFSVVPTLENPTPKSYVPKRYQDPKETPLMLEVPEKSGKISCEFIITP